MEHIPHQYNLLQNLKQKYSLSHSIYDLFKKYQTLLVIKKMLTVKKTALNPEINIKEAYLEILGNLNVEYSESMDNYNLKYSDNINTLGNLLENIEKRLNLLNLLLINKDLYSLELIDFLIPISIQGKLLYQIIEYLYNTYPSEHYSRKLYQKHIDSGISLESTTHHLEAYHITISRNLSIYHLLMEYLNIKSEDLYKENAIKNLKKKNSKGEETVRNIHTTFYYKIDHLDIDYLYFKVISKKLDLKLFSQFLDIPHESLEVLESEELKNKFQYQFILTSENFKSLELIKIDKKLRLYQKYILKYVFLKTIELIDTQIIYKYLESEVTLDKKVEVYSHIKETVMGREMIIFQTLMKFYRTTNVETNIIKKVENIIDNLQK